MKIKTKVIDDLSAAKHYVDCCGDSVEGDGGSNQLFGVLVHLLKNWPQDVAREAAEYYNATKCSPSWNDKEFEHKWEDAITRVGGAYTKPVAKAKKSIVVPQVKVTTNSTLPKPMDNATLTHLKTCFASDEFVNIAVTTKDKRPVNGGATATAGEWVEALETSSSIYSVMKDEPLAKEANGCYVCVNPLITDDGRNKDNVAAYRHLLVEFDTGTLEDQWNIIVSSHLPCSVVINSGGKSLHAWVKINAKDADEYSTRQKLVYESLAPYGIDKQNSDPCRYSRLAGQKRQDKMQHLLAVNIGCFTFEEWEVDLKLRSFWNEYPKPQSIIEFQRPLDNDPDELLKYRFLCKGGGMLVVGGSGIGKSVLQTQMAMSWALGKECLGVKPSRILKSLIIQAEDDSGDVGEMQESMQRKMGITKGSSEETMLRENVIMVPLNSANGDKFLKCLETYLRVVRPDIVWLNPILSYLGADANSQKDVGMFLRNGLNPLLTQYSCAAILIHHCAKPLRDSKDTWTVRQFSYFGLGSVEWSNWARTAFAVLETGVHTTFILRAAKKGERLKWSSGSDKYIRHTRDENTLFWELANADEIADAQSKALANKQTSKKQETTDFIFALIPDAPKTIFRHDIERQTSIATNTINHHCGILEEQGKIQISKVVGRVAYSRIAEINETPKDGEEF